MKAAITSDGCEHLAINNLAPALGVDWYTLFGFKKLWGNALRPEEGSNPEVLFVKGWFVPDYCALSRMQRITGDLSYKYNERCKKAEKIVILWAGSDILECAKWRARAGHYEPQMFRDLRTDRFMHVPVSTKQKYELDKLLGIDATDPLPTPARELFDLQPMPHKFTIAVYMPTYNLDMYRYDVCLEVARLMPEATFIFYHWMLPVGPKGVVDESGVPNAQYKYACSFGEYKEIIAQSWYSLRLTRHEGLSGGAGDFLMAGRPVLTCHDMPEWPAVFDNEKIGSGKQDAKHISEKIKKCRLEVSEKTRGWYLDNLDPKKYKERMNELLKKQWPGFSL